MAAAKHVEHDAERCSGGEQDPDDAGALGFDLECNVQAAEGDNQCRDFNQPRPAPVHQAAQAAFASIARRLWRALRLRSGQAHGEAWVRGYRSASSTWCT